MAEGIRKKVTYRGRVQGVGFRYSTRSLARGFEVTGYVRNMPDGSVELLAEGEAGEVERFLRAVSSRMSGYIQSAEEQEGRPTGSYGEFEIAF